jgi:hypothetical protein
MKKGDYVQTPRFLKCKIAEVFDNANEARKEGYTEPTYYESTEYDVHGKHIGTNRMAFAAIRK